MKNNHLAGVIPIRKNDFSYKFDWPDSMMPIAENLTAIERSVMECAYAGCRTIWIVCNDDVSPLIRHRVGELVQDPVWLRTLDPRPYKTRKPIPIYYVPISPKHRDKIDSYGWGILYGALSAFKITARFSDHFATNKYYVSFPYSTYDPSVVREHRAQIISDTGFFLRHDNKTIKDGEMLGFTFGKEDFVRFRRVCRKEGTKLYKPFDDLYGPKEMLPPAERYSARFFTLDKIFGSVNINEGNVVDLAWRYDISNWEGYKSYIGSEHQNTIKRPNKLFLSPRKTPTIGLDYEHMD